MTTRLLLIRHGASHHKIEGIIGGPRGCRGLTPEGRQQAEKLGKRLVTELSEPLAPVYSSVVPRAIETAEILAIALGKTEVLQDCGLCSWHTPADADGQPGAEFSKQRRLTGGGVFRPFEEGNESWSELVSRTGRTLEQIASRHVNQTVVVATHAETVESSLIVFGGLPFDRAFDLSIANTSVTEWTTDGDPDAWPRPRWKLVRLNDHAHTSHKL